MEQNQIPDNKILPQAIYRAVGWVAGIYQPSEENINIGTFVTEDGLSIPAKINGRLRGNLSKKHIDYEAQPDFFSQPRRWTIYPKTEPLRFELVVMKPLAPEPENAPLLDEFRIVGQIKSSSDGTVNIRIQRNQPYIQGDKAKEYSFVLTLKGILPDSSVGQVWALVVKRQAENLVIVASEPYTPSEEDLLFLERNANKQVEVIEAAKNSPPDAIILERSLLELQKELASPTAASNSQQTKGETELSPEINAEPQAQKNVPSESKRTTTTNTLDKQQLSLPEEKQPNVNSTTTDIAELLGSQSKFFVESTPNPNTFVRPERSPQQRRDALAAAKNKPLADGTTKNTSTFQQQPQKPRKKQPTLSSTARVESKSLKPAFQVKVDNRVYNGFSSVVLKNRLIYIDDKPVASGKLAIVLGSPILMQADGKVTQGENQALLIGK